MNEQINNVWNKRVPIEKSQYIYTNSEDITIFNKENFELIKNKPIMIDLFCGAGGFSVGCQWAGFQSILGIDYFKPAIDTWMKNHPNAISILGDIRYIEPQLIRTILNDVGVKEVDLITGGVPCQGFSLNNRKHNDEDERNYLFIDYMKIVEEFKPKYIILENVSGMKSTAGGKFVKTISEYMDKAGYNVNIELLNAADYGVPQIRKRLIFVGVKRKFESDITIFNFPKGKFTSNEIDSKSNLKTYRTVYDAISDLPPIESNENSTNYTMEPLTEYQKLMRGYSNILEKKKCEVLSNHVSPKHPSNTIEKIKNTEPGMPMYEKYKQRIRLDYSKPSPTQVAGGIRPQFQFGHPERNRGLTIRERARIQSFPDSYIFCGGTVQERVQTGNAVPPLLIYNIAKELIHDFNKENNK